MTPVQLLIERDERGKVSISGPINDKALCYGLLECARDAIKDFIDKQAQQQITLAKPGDVQDASRDRSVSFGAGLRS